MNICLNCRKIRHSAVMQGCTCQYSMQALAAPVQEPLECLDCGSSNVGIPATYDSLVDSVKTQPN
jgi:hypothetical protein